MYSWVEQKSTIKEAESNYTVQGFNLNYVGVIISLFYPFVFYFLFIFNKDHTPKPTTAILKQIVDNRFSPILIISRIRLVMNINGDTMFHFKIF
ncbi:DNA/RNA helicase domain-containing protein [Lysinibacillus sp. G4S2]|uniref:DNA/RNA helicase domain-containing protein n=1 Tax=Lysinibacillus sp. G4S2 TaxID=3055859 RepID=UPI0025A05CF7|nr:DNA/RNA helicase domain-containing protein [Lysinibacillus sp. G4S2]MDM5250062.1 DUF2075 domain-containing protein [Lysinibacillus sp. G4S2]